MGYQRVSPMSVKAVYACTAATDASDLRCRRRRTTQARHACRPHGDGAALMQERGSTAEARCRCGDELPTNFHEGGPHGRVSVVRSPGFASRQMACNGR